MISHVVGWQKLGERCESQCFLMFTKGRKTFLGVRRENFLVFKVCYVSSSDTRKSRISENSNHWFLSTATKRTNLTRAGIT